MSCNQIALLYVNKDSKADKAVIDEWKNTYGYVRDEWENTYEMANCCLKAIGYSFDRISLNGLRGGVLEARKYKVLVLPCCDTLSTGDAEIIRCFTENGGRIFAVSLTHSAVGVFRNTVAYNCFFWRTADRVPVLRNILAYLLTEDNLEKPPSTAPPKPEGVIRLGYHISPFFPINIDVLRRYNLAPDYVVLLTGHKIECKEAEGAQYMYRDLLFQACHKMREAGVPFMLWSEGNSFLGVYNSSTGGMNQGKDSFYYPRAFVDKIKKATRKYFMGCSMTESVSGQTCKRSFFSSARDMKDAKNKYVKGLSKWVAYNRDIGIPIISSFEVTSLHRYNYEAGIDNARAEIAYDQNLNVQLSSIRGSGKAYKKPWSVDISLWRKNGVCSGCFTQPPEDLKRVYYLAYIYGADPILLQTNGVVMGAGKIMGRYPGKTGKTIQERYEDVYAAFYKFVNENPRVGKPVVKATFLQGNLDAWANFNQRNGPWGLGQGGKWERNENGVLKHVQEGVRTEWMSSDPEFGWNYLSVYYPGYTNGRAKKDTDFSATPYGPVDITPVEATDDILEEYDLVLLTGWNTMTPEIYRKLKKYCMGGGHLFLAIPHLSSHIKREDAIEGNYKLLKNGDYSDFLGIKVRGRGGNISEIAFTNSSDFVFPENKSYDVKGTDLATIELITATTVAGSLGGPVLVENKVGKGTVLTLCTWNYPGKKELNCFVEDVIRCLAATHQGQVRVRENKDIAYTVIENGMRRTIYLVNTSEKCRSLILEMGQKQIPMSIDGMGIRIVDAETGKIKT